MQLALALFSGAVIIPLLQVFWTSLSILTGGLYFQEFNHFDWTRGLVFFFGLCVLFVGVYFLVPPPPDEEEMQGATLTTKARKKAAYARRASNFVGPGLLDFCEFAKEDGEGGEGDVQVVPGYSKRMSVYVGNYVAGYDATTGSLELTNTGALTASFATTTLSSEAGDFIQDAVQEAVNNEAVNNESPA